MFNLYNQHKGTTTIYPPVRSVEEARSQAEAAARLGYNAFYRVFRQVPAGEQFETAFSVLNGEVREHPEVTFPDAHW